MILLFCLLKLSKSISKIKKNKIKFMKKILILINKFIIKNKGIEVISQRIFNKQISI